MTREQAKQVWRRRLRMLFLCANADDNAKTAFEGWCQSTICMSKRTLTDVADLLSQFFYDIDLVPTDVWAGLLLLANREHAITHSNRRLEALGWPRNTKLDSHKSLSTDAPPRLEWMSVHNAARMMHFAIAIYGWPYYVYSNCSPGACATLSAHARCCHQCRCNDVSEFSLGKRRIITYRL